MRSSLFARATWPLESSTTIATSDRHDMTTHPRHSESMK